MFLQYVSLEGKLSTVQLAGRTSFTIGRTPEASLCIADPKISRIHAEIRFWDGEFVLKDFKSRNGTFVNDARADVAVLHSGDKIRIGPVEFHVEAEKESAKGARTILREVAQEMEQGNKGYRTVLREIVQSADKPNPKRPAS